MSDEAAIDAALEQLGEADPAAVDIREIRRQVAASALPPTAIDAMATTAPRRRRFWRRAVRALALGFTVVVALWIGAAYVVLPWAWRHYERQPGMANAPKFSVTAAGIPGDPLNLGLIGGEEHIVQAMLAAGWKPADPINWRTSLGIARSVLAKHPDPTAPVSNLYVFGRKQDMAFEKAAKAGGSASQRHHVRFWRADDLGQNGAPFWLGAATFDRSVGFSHLTGQITHHIAADIDAERDAVVDALSQVGWLTQVYQVTGVGATLLGRNGGGDRFHTDGELTIGVLAQVANSKQTQPLDPLDNPTPVALKDQFWDAIRPILRSLPDSAIPAN